MTEEEYLKIVKFFKNERMTLNRVTQECMKELITAAIILKFNLKVPKKSGEKIKINFLKNIRFINEIKNILKFENDKYLDNMEKKLTDICLSNPKDINKVVSNFMEDFYIFDENSKIRNIIINLINNFKNLENEDRKKEIEKIVWNIWIINEKEIIPFLCSEEEKFTEENIYNKLKKYSSYTIQKNNILFNNIENFNFFEKQFTYENIKIFLENLDYKLMINYLKLFLFCCRPNEFISEKQISENFSTYSSLKKYIKSIETNEIISNEITELLFHAKIKNLLLIFEEKILSFSKEDILNLKNQDLIDLRRKSYFDILDEYIKNELILLDNLKLIYKELYTLNDSRTTRIIKKLNKYENDLDFELYEFLRKKSKEIEENKQNSNFSRKDVNKKNTISYSYLNAIKEFSFSNWLCHNKQLINSHFYRGVSELPYKLLFAVIYTHLEFRYEMSHTITSHHVHHFHQTRIPDGTLLDYMVQYRKPLFPQFFLYPKKFLPENNPHHKEFHLRPYIQNNANQ